MFYKTQEKIGLTKYIISDFDKWDIKSIMFHKTQEKVGLTKYYTSDFEILAHFQKLTKLVVLK